MAAMLCFAGFFPGHAQPGDDVWFGLGLLRFLGVRPDRGSSAHQLLGHVPARRAPFPKLCADLEEPASELE
jgi:hypothetical protein